MNVKRYVPYVVRNFAVDTISSIANNLYLEKRGLEDHENRKLQGTVSKLARFRAYICLNWLILLATSVCLLWMVWSHFYWPCRFTSSGAVLVCSSILGEVWLSHGHFKSAYKALDRGIPVKIFAGSHVGIYLNFFVFSKSLDPSKFPGDFIIASDGEQYSAGLGSEASKIWKKLVWSLTNPLSLLLELAHPSELTKKPLEISSPDMFTFSSYKRGWHIGRTGARIERSASRIIIYNAVVGTLVWAYGDILQSSSLICTNN